VRAQRHLRVLRRRREEGAAQPLPIRPHLAPEGPLSAWAASLRGVAESSTFCGPAFGQPGRDRTFRVRLSGMLSSRRHYAVQLALAAAEMSAASVA